MSVNTAISGTFMVFKTTIDKTGAYAFGIKKIGPIIYKADGQKMFYTDDMILKGQTWTRKTRPNSDNTVTVEVLKECVDRDAAVIYVRSLHAKVFPNDNLCSESIIGDIKISNKQAPTNG